MFALPLQEIRIFRLSRETSPHHNGLEALSVDGPEMTISCRGNRRCPLAIVKNSELPQHLTVLQGTKIFAISRHLDLTLWKGMSRSDM